MTEGWGAAFAALLGEWGGVWPRGLEFHSPGFLTLLVGLPIWWILIWPRAGYGLLHAEGDRIGSVGRGSRLMGSIVLALPRFLRSAAIVCLILALASPHRVDVVREVSIAGRGIALAVDLSSSMLARDMEGGASRIEVAKEAAVRFAENRTYDEQSLIGFAAQSVTRVPPTTDPNLVVAGVRSLEIQLVRDGTDISGALLTATARLIDSDREPKVIVLLTDGAHNGVSVPPLTAARAAAALGVRIHSISMQGPEDSSPRPGGTTVPGGPGRIVMEMRTVLEGISEITGGTYSHAADGAGLDSIYREIDRIEAPVEEVTEREVRYPVRGWFLLFGLLLPGCEALIRGSRWGVIP